MIQTIFSGVGLGLTLAIMCGPAFFALLQTSIDKGFYSAVRLSVGICLSDAFLIAIAFLGIARLMEKPMVSNIVGLVGGGMLIGMGIHTILSQYKGREIHADDEIKEVKKIEENISHLKIIKPSTFYLRGFLLNLMNPAVWFFWIFSVSLVSTQYINEKGGPDIFYLIIFFVCTLGTVFLTDVLKSFGAHRLRTVVNDKIMSKVSLIFALILLGFGIYLIAKSTYPIFEIIHDKF